MNPQPELESDTLRSEINTTRDRMDSTIDALGNRLEGRHLVDELLGFFRGRADDARRVREQLGRRAETAVHSVVDTVKAHPAPVLLAGAGIAWLIYETVSEKRPRSNGWAPDEADEINRGYATAEPGDYDRLAGGTAVSEDTGALGTLQDKASAVTGQARDKLAEVGEQARDKFAQVKERSRETLHAAKEKVGEVTGQVQQRSREIYDQTRDRVVSTADEYPLAVGLGCLAAGVLIALALPTPDVLNRRVGPTVDRLKDRTREAGAEAIEKGKRIVQAAAGAAQEEARKQGVMPGDANVSGDRPDAPSITGNTSQMQGATAIPGTARSVDDPESRSNPS